MINVWHNYDICCQYTIYTLYCNMPLYFNIDNLHIHPPPHITLQSNHTAPTPPPFYPSIAYQWSPHPPDPTKMLWKHGRRISHIIFVHYFIIRCLRDSPNSVYSHTYPYFWNRVSHNKIFRLQKKKRRFFGERFVDFFFVTSNFFIIFHFKDNLFWALLHVKNIVFWYIYFKIR